MHLVLRADRLAVLARHLEKLQKQPEAARSRRFTIAAWGRREIGTAGSDANCATVACALGEAALLPQFNAEGLRLIPATPAPHVVSLLPVYREGHRGYFELEAAQRFFGLKRKQAEHLFMPDEYEGIVTPGTVARRIRRLLREHKKAAA
jgi:hypothetical protein